ncbi:MAG: hypothetical protein AB7E80_09815 [Hyphomicrobiaceae bacterium]
MSDRSSAAAHWVQALGTVVSAAVGAAAAWFALTTYIDSAAKQVDERKVQVFSLHHRFNSEPLFSIRKRVYADVARAAGCQSEDLSAGPSDANDRFAFVEFFDVVGACVDAGLCDQGLVQRLFAPYANVHWTYLSGYISAVRKGEAAMKLDAPFGSGMEKLAKLPSKMRC